MAKPIKLTEALKKQALDEFAKILAEMKMSDGKISYNKNFVYKDDENKAQILFTPLAYSKMISLIMAFDSEVAWHGVGERIDSDEFKFIIRDILVYPQTVSGSTVTMDPETYMKWLIENDEDDRFNHIIMQGHSHVNFSTTPSATDLKHQDDILSQLKDDMCYIFLIWNKKLEHSTKIYDLANNVLYEDKDIVYGIVSDDCDVPAFVEEAKKIVKTQAKVVTPATSAYGGGYGYGGYYGGYNGGTAKQQSAPKSKNKNNKQNNQTNLGSGWNGRGTEDMDDWADDYWKDRFNT